MNNQSSKRSSLIFFTVLVSLSCSAQTVQDSLLRNSATLDEIIRLSSDSCEVDSVEALYAQIDDDVKMYSDAYPSLNKFPGLKVAYFNGYDVMNTQDDYINQELDAILITYKDDFVSVCQGTLFIDMGTGELVITDNYNGCRANFKIAKDQTIERKP